MALRIHYARRARLYKCVSWSAPLTSFRDGRVNRSSNAVPRRCSAQGSKGDTKSIELKSFEFDIGQHPEGVVCGPDGAAIEP